eukprot:1197797-Pyramimonas_sp.AAC.1
MQRRRDTPMTDFPTRRHLSKLIKKETRAIKRACRRTAIDEILQKSQGLKSISGMKSSKHKEFITEMASQGGNIVRDRQSIANVFADFYQALYQDIHKNGNPYKQDSSADAIMPDFTGDELDHVLRGLKNNKAADQNGIVAEMLKKGGGLLR